MTLYYGETPVLRLITRMQDLDGFGSFYDYQLWEKELSDDRDVLTYRLLLQGSCPADTHFHDTEALAQMEELVDAYDLADVLHQTIELTRNQEVVLMQSLVYHKEA